MLLVDSSREDQARRLDRDGAWYGLKRAALRQARILGARRLAAHLGCRNDGHECLRHAREITLAR